MSIKEAKKTAEIAVEVAKGYRDNQREACKALQETKKQAIGVRSLWREGNKSKLIEMGIALIIFPEPTPISEIIGVGFLVAGGVQRGVKNRSAYMEDIPKSITNALRDINSLRL
ncbi:MAG: hypothetical protein WDA42_07010 [Candidatus Bathyarchaeia archaeon]